MSMMAKGRAAEFRDKKIAVNALWPRTAIYTAAVEWMLGPDSKSQCRTPEIIADAAHAILISDPTTLTGQTLLDEDFLKIRGVSDFEKYACEPGQDLYPDFFVDE
jgi:hypothetical protein